MKTNIFTAKVLAKTRAHLNSGTEAIESLDEGARLTLSMMIGVSGLIGIWAFAGLISAFIGSGGILELSRSWFSAVMGL